jgi:group II intron reverse transcriptase/maturase
MQESYKKDVADHLGPESCIRRREVSDEALTGVRPDPVLSCEIKDTGVPTPLTEAEGPIGDDDQGEPSPDPAQSKTRRMSEHSMRENRETPKTSVSDGEADRPEKVTRRTSGMHVSGESDGRIVPTNPPNNAGLPTAAEAGEGRRPTKGNAERPTTDRTQGRPPVSSGLLRVREAARRDGRARFTALLHHVNLDLLRESYYDLKRQAAPGVDGVTWGQYEEGIEERLKQLQERVHGGTYRAQPSLRTYLPKADGQKRPLGIAALEDKIVQAAVVEVLNAVYEEDFLGFSYGFRPGRSPHDALDALWVGRMEKKVNWVLDADIRGFFDTIDHEWLVTFIEHRIGDPRIVRLIRKWLGAGVSEEGRGSKTTQGVPQGSVASPLLANVYLHYVLDLWVEQWRRTTASGDVIIVRYADDFVLGFQFRHEAERFLEALRDRLAQFGLALHPDKTRLIEFGRYAAENRKRRGQRKPEPFDFLGFTHFCGQKYRGQGFRVKRRTTAKRLREAIGKVRQTLIRLRHLPVSRHAEWLIQVVRGYFNYHAIPGNSEALETFRREVVRGWMFALKRRSQRHKITWDRLGPLANAWLPKVQILHPFPKARFYANHPR